MQPDLVNADLINANLDGDNFIQDKSNEFGEDNVSKDDDDGLSDRESDIDRLDRDLEEDDSDNNSDMQWVVRKNVNHFISVRSEWVKDFCTLDASVNSTKTAIYAIVNRQNGICPYEHKELTLLAQLTVIHYNRPLEAHKDQWDWLVNQRVDPKYTY
ncbi:hypothetical protein Cgig2_012968 [Carnegiea gigantea]|uniref:Transposase n=1 Tax=Carnegiea gigantea TaxID=171969 RepID=A0A9Q1K202_9CARY|nr:hypothetical protein Cgig2_012968 [Carnegiea gigantea]